MAGESEESGQRRALEIVGRCSMDATAIAFGKLSISWKRDRSSEIMMLLGAEERMAEMRKFSLMFGPKAERGVADFLGLFEVHSCIDCLLWMAVNQTQRNR